MTTRYLQGDVVDQLFARIDSSGDTYWLLGDHLGSVREVTDESGTVLDTIAYDGYGNIASETNSAYRGRYAWTSRELDVETGLQYNRARYYDPSIGRWISQDPLGFDAGDSNLYRYATNRPTMDLDPSGMEWLPLTRSKFEDILEKTNRLQRDGKDYFKRRGDQFEEFARQALNLPRNTVAFATPHKAFPTGITPDFTKDILYRWTVVETLYARGTTRWIPISVTRTPGSLRLQSGVWFDAKIQQSNIGLRNSDVVAMIQGLNKRYNDIGPKDLDGMPARNEVHGVLILLTPDDVRITQNLINLATSNKVQILQMKAEYEHYNFAGNNSLFFIRFGGAVTLNDLPLAASLSRSSPLFNGQANPTNPVAVPPVWR